MANNTNAIDVRVNMCTLMSVVLRSADLATVARSLHARVQQAPHFFLHTPIIVDFSELAVDAGYNYGALFKVIRQQQLLPVAVRGVPENLREQLQAAGVPIVEQNSPRRKSQSQRGSACGARRNSRHARSNTDD